MGFRRTFAVACTSLSLTAGSAWAQDAKPVDRDVSLTIYSHADPASFDPQQFIAQQRMGFDPNFVTQVPGFGIVRDMRELDLKQGGNVIHFTDVAQFIDPTTVSLTDLSVPAEQMDAKGLKVVEQKFQFDLVSPQKLMERYLDQQITVNQNLGDGKREAVTGTLLSSNQNQLVLRTDQGLRILGWSQDIQLGALPQGLITKPTLEWQLWAPEAGKRNVRTAYQTDGITWRADYNLVLNDTDTKADLGGWVTIMNLSGASFANANLKLIAGDVQRIQPPRQMAYGGMAKNMRMDAAMAAAPEGFEEKSFFEYHMYTLPRRTTVDQNATQQIALFPTVRDVTVEKVLVYYGLPEARYWIFPEPQQDRNLGTATNKKVDVYIRLRNKEDNKLGIPLPKGKMRVFKVDSTPAEGGKAKADGALEFVGEDLIDHTARNATVLVKIGQAFDVTGERVQTDFRANFNAHWIEESIKITMKNGKKQPQKVVIKENLYRWVNWEVTKKTADFEKVDSRTVHFDVEVPADGEKVVEYTVKYTW